MKTVYTRRARRHFESIFNYIALRNPAAATRVLARIEQTIELISTMPESGRRGEIQGTREFRVANLPYVIVHRLGPGQSTITILGIYHTAQRRPGRRL